jgi:hypothetical protein
MTEFDAWFTPLRAVLTLAITAGGAFVGIIAWAVRVRTGVSAEIGRAQEKTDDKLVDLGGRIDKSEANARAALSAVDAMQHHVQALPTAAQLHQLTLDVAGLLGRLDVTAEAINGQRELMLRVERSLDRQEAAVAKLWEKTK